MPENLKPAGKNLANDSVRYYSFILLAAIVIVSCYLLQVPTVYIGWFSFFLASLSVAGNDAIQTIGTFIESKKDSPLKWKVLVFCGILFLFLLLDWYGMKIPFLLDGNSQQEIHFGRLQKIEPVESYNLIQLLAPIILLIVTRLKAPISTTFLILSLFSTNTNVITGMLTKSLIGYGIAFSIAMLAWGFLAWRSPQEYKDDYVPDEQSEKFWSIVQWISTSFLWMAWVLQDIANIAVYIPRQLNFLEFFLAASIMSLCLAYILKNNGGRIQEIVSEKSDIREAKAASYIDLVYATILLIFKKLNSLPMSTTWVFLGLLAGREIILHVVTRQDDPYLDTFRKVSKDVMLASLGIGVSLGIYFLAKNIYG